MAALPSIEKDPQAGLPYGRDWEPWLTEGNRGTITTSTWSVDPDDSLTISGPAFLASGMTSVWVAGGELNADYTLTNHVVTTLLHEDDRSIKVKVRRR